GAWCRRHLRVRDAARRAGRRPSRAIQPPQAALRR
ncbi:MAG: hypothetical protein AVDCRST_MAG76-2264, partial [uncultured Acidimicrobiales bacterium]